MTTKRDVCPTVETTLSGYELTNYPALNKGISVTQAERNVFQFHGLLPPHVGVLEDQVARRMIMLRASQTKQLPRFPGCKSLG
jgi:malate dehydrogenase (oxaloacetate-decarboxylating)